MPSDITGTDIIEEDPTTGHRRWTFVPGPIFGNILLADEINRTPPKTQSALLEAMQELSCTVRGNHYKLPSPFFVLATQNPIELEGTYPLPEAQLDRFLFNTVLDYLSAEDEVKVVDLTTTTRVAQVEAVTNAAGDSRFSAAGAHGARSRNRSRTMWSSLVRATRHKSGRAPDFVKKYVNYGASVRAAQFIVLAAKARALSRGRYHVAYEDITALADSRAAPPHPAQFPRRIRPHRFGRNPAAPARARCRRRREPDRAALSRSSGAGAASRASTSSPRRSSTVSSPACTARRISVSARSSPNIAPIRRATICATSTGTFSRAPSAPTSSAIAAKPTACSPFCSTPATP